MVVVPFLLRCCNCFQCKLIKIDSMAITKPAVDSLETFLAFVSAIGGNVTEISRLLFTEAIQYHWRINPSSLLILIPNDECQAHLLSFPCCVSRISFFHLHMLYYILLFTIYYTKQFVENLFLILSKTTFFYSTPRTVQNYTR